MNLERWQLLAILLETCSWKIKKSVEMTITRLIYSRYCYPGGGFMVNTRETRLYWTSHVLVKSWVRQLSNLSFIKKFSLPLVVRRENLGKQRGWKITRQKDESGGRGSKMLKRGPLFDSVWVRAYRPCYGSDPYQTWWAYSLGGCASF